MKSIATFIAIFSVGSLLALADEKPAAPDGAGAAPAKHDPAEMFKKLDTNSDGKISQEEFLVGKKNPEKAKEAFKQKDANGDGFLTMEELSAHGPKKNK